ncbi:hypothetical protein LLG46_06545 [bacterium]|nr:hypothetical protein [bacterium]
MKCGHFNIDDDAEVHELLKSTDYVPPAPDCRQAVMAKIVRRPSKSRSVWFYAFGLIPVAALVLVLFIMNKPVPPESEIAMAPRLPKAAEPANSIVAPRPKVDVETVKQEQPKEPGVHYKSPGVPHRVEPRKKYSIPKKRLPIIDRKPSSSKLQASVDKDEPKQPQPAIEPIVEAPVTIVAVTNEVPDDNYSYSTTERDPATGNITQCSGLRSGNMVMVYVDVESGD